MVNDSKSTPTGYQQSNDGGIGDAGLGTMKI